MAAPMGLAKCVCVSIKTANIRLLSRASCYIRPHNVYTCLTINAQHNAASHIKRGLATNADEEDSDDKDVIDKMRDVSRLSPRHANMMSHRAKPPDLTQGLPYMENRDFKRRLYLKYGKDTGIDPGIMWLSKEELAEIREDEEEWGEPSLREMLDELQAEQQRDMEQRRDKEKLVEKQLARMPELIEQFKQKRLKVLMEEKEQSSRKKALLEEARDHFGFDLDPRSERFQALMTQRAEEKKELRKKEKKEKREAAIQRGEVAGR